jgi:methyl-accepting chemotaxis protein
VSKAVSRLNIRQKVFALFFFLLGTLAGVAYLTVTELASINGEVVNIGRSVLPETQLFGDLADATQHFRLLQAEHVFVVAPADLDLIERDMRNTDTKVLGLLDRLTKVASGDELNTLTDLRAAWMDFAKSGEELAKLSRDNEDTLVGKLYHNDAAKLFARLSDLLRKASAANVASGDAAARTSVATVSHTRWALGGIVGIAVLVCIIAMLYLRRAVMRPIMTTAQLMRQLAAHDLETPIMGAERTDEIGDMMKSLIVFRDSIVETTRLHAARAKEQEERARLTEQDNRLSQNFSREVHLALQELGSATQGLGQTADDLSSHARLGAGQAERVAQAAQSASQNVSAVASATDQLVAAIRDVTSQAAQSSAEATAAVREAAETLKIVTDLTHAATRIGDVVGVIDDIADQTHLLALNATIEAARAGDAGRGFAVVASEVRSLAGETGRATEEISSQVTMMQSAARKAAEAIGRIDRTITRMNDASGTIAAVIGEQQAATTQIAHNINEAARGTAEVSRNITTLNEITHRTGQSSTDVLTAAKTLTSQTGRLRDDVDGYLANISRSAG